MQVAHPGASASPCKRGSGSSQELPLRHRCLLHHLPPQPRLAPFSALVLPLSLLAADCLHAASTQRSKELNSSTGTSSSGTAFWPTPSLGMESGEPSGNAAPKPSPALPSRLLCTEEQEPLPLEVWAPRESQLHHVRAWEPRAVQWRGLLTPSRSSVGRLKEGTSAASMGNVEGARSRGPQNGELGEGAAAAAANGRAVGAETCVVGGVPPVPTRSR